MLTDSRTERDLERTSLRRDVRIGLNVDTASWIVRTKLEVADGHARQAIESLERDSL